MRTIATEEVNQGTFILQHNLQHSVSQNQIPVEIFCQASTIFHPAVLVVEYPGKGENKEGGGVSGRLSCEDDTPLFPEETYKFNRMNELLEELNIKCLLLPRLAFVIVFKLPDKRSFSAFMMAQQFVNVVGVLELSRLGLCIL